ncbi:MAG: hypothetical protein ABJA82_19005, partial [Myxococcales bacterium]
SSMYDFPYDELELIVFDQLVTPVAYYLAKDEVQGWFAGEGFRDVELRWHNKMSWTATATVQRAASSATQAVNGSEGKGEGKGKAKALTGAAAKASAP